VTANGRASEEMIARARRSWSPSATDADRVRRSIDAALVHGTGQVATERALPARNPALWTLRILCAGAIAAASAAGGYRAGRRAAQREAPPVATERPRAPEEAARLGPAKVVSPVINATRAVAAPAAPPLLLPAPDRALPPRGARRAGEGRDQVPGDTLAIEIQAMRNVERALRDGKPGLALAFLDKLDREAPNGRLAEERDAAATVAKCARGDIPFGVNPVEDFALRHPASVYRIRVAQACARTDSPATGDSAGRRSDP